MSGRVRLQRSKGWRLPADAVSVAYPTKWQNPYRNVRPREESVKLYRDYLNERPELIDAAKRELAGKRLACWCPLDGPCHADVLIALAGDSNRAESETQGGR